MNRLLIVLFFFIVLVACKSTPEKAPVIPMEDFFRNPEKTAFKLSPNGEYFSYLAPWEKPAIGGLEQIVRDQPDDADHDDAEDDLAGREQGLAVDDHVTDAGRRADQFGHDHVGPGPAQHQPQRLEDLGRRSGQHDP